MTKKTDQGFSINGRIAGLLSFYGLFLITGLSRFSKNPLMGRSALAFNMVETTGFEPAASYSRSMGRGSFGVLWGLV